MSVSEILDALPDLDAYELAEVIAEATRLRRIAEQADSDE